MPGPAFVLDAIGFDEHMRSSAFVVTGEGRLDETTLAGKAVAEVATRCRQAGVWCHAVVGRDELDLFGRRVLDLASVHEARDPRALRRAGRRARLAGSREVAEPVVLGRVLPVLVGLGQDHPADLEEADQEDARRR